jgi:hypothetical protein
VWLAMAKERFAMSIFDKLWPGGKKRINYRAIELEFTPEEIASIQRNKKRYATIAGLDGPKGTELVVTKKVMDAITAQGLAERVEDVMRGLESRQVSSTDFLIAIKTMMKAYVVHNLPVYLYQVAGMFEFIGDEENANELFRQFLKAQSDFEPDPVDLAFLEQTGFEVEKIVAIAKGKIR